MLSHALHLRRGARRAHDVEAGSRLFAALALAAVAATSGCRFGQAAFTGNIDGRAFDPTGTVFAYVDEHDDALVQDKRPRVVVAMTWIVFDPERDLNDVDGSTLEDMAHEMRLRDALALVFDDQGVLSSGQTHEGISDANGPTPNDDLVAFVHLAPERLSPQTGFADFTPFGSKRTTTVKLDRVSFTDVRPVISGGVELSFTSTQTDPGVTHQGSFSGTFEAPIIEERLAESNLALLGADTIVGLPLAPRAP